MSDRPPLTIEDLRGERSFALIRRQGASEIDLLVGPVVAVDRLADIPLRDELGGAGARTDVLAVIPFRQVGEQGFEHHDDGAPLLCLVVEHEQQLPLGILDAEALPDRLDLTDVSYDLDDDAYADVVQRIVRDEIGGGEGANFVIRRMLSGQVRDWSIDGALGVFRNLLRQERGAYWTFLVNTGDRVLVGASPERHLSSAGGVVTMNPISGTFRLAAPAGDHRDLRTRFEAFLRDEKEILELMMVVDEELKMMAGMCPEGGTVIGPLFKRMSHLVHTEYELTGRSELDVRDLLKESMFAATVVGSPVENACRIIRKYEASGRGYYGAVLGRIGRDGDGATTLDAPILIRTADIDASGRLTGSVGATLVRDSVPTEEVAETKAKLGGLLSALGLQDPPASAPDADIAAMLPEFADLLEERNARLSPFWIHQTGGKLDPDPGLTGRSVLIVAAEDNFVTMLAHLLRSLGVTVAVQPWTAVEAGDLAAYDVVLMGPGPGDPRRTDDKRIVHLRALTVAQLEAGRPLLAVCLGHQMLSAALGLALGLKRSVLQGAQETLDVFGEQRAVGFYNTFTAEERELPGVEMWARDGEVHALRGERFVGLQFHAESVLTPQGREILQDALRSVLAT